MSANCLAKIWYAFRCLLDPKSDEKLGIPRLKCRILGFSIAQVFQIDLSNKFDEVFPEGEFEKIVFAKFRNFICRQLFDIKIEGNNNKSTITLEAISCLSDACWAICKKKNLPDSERNNDRLFYNFWLLFISKAFTDKTPMGVRIPVYMEIEELTELLLELADRLSLNLGLKYQIKNTIELLIQEFQPNSNFELIDIYETEFNKRDSGQSMRDDKDICNFCPDDFIDFPQAVRVLQEFIKKFELIPICVTSLLDHMSNDTTKGLLKKGTLSRIKDVNCKTLLSSGIKNVYIELNPSSMILYADRNGAEKLVEIPISDGLSVETFHTSEKGKNAYRFRIIENGQPIVLFEASDEIDVYLWISAFQQALRLHRLGIEFANIHEFRKREDIREERKIKYLQEQENWQNLQKAYLDLKHEHNEESKVIQSEKIKLQRTLNQWNEEREPLLKAKTDLSHELERVQFERNLLEIQLDELKETRLNLEKALSTAILDQEEELIIHEETVSSPRTAAKLEEEIRALEKFDRHFENYQKKVKHLVDSYQARCDFFAKRLREAGLFDAIAEEVEKNHPVFSLTTEPENNNEVLEAGLFDAIAEEVENNNLQDSQTLPLTDFELEVAEIDNEHNKNVD